MNVSKDSGKKPINDEAQVKAFRKAARELGADESEERFEDALRKIAKRKENRESEKN